MSIQELRRLNVKNGGHFFDRETMKHFGDRLSDFVSTECGNETIEVYSPKRKRAWRFSKRTGRMLPPEDF